MRNLVGAFLILVFLTVYVVAALAIADRLPDNRLVEIVYFAVVGLAWGVPILPLVSWMGRRRR